jgi:hypothetical protein
MKRILITPVIILVCYSFASSQKFRLDSNYVQSFKEKFILVLHASGQYNSLEIKQAVSPDSTNSNLAYPTLKSSLGFTFNYKWLNFSYGKNIFEYILKDYYEEKLKKSGPASITNYGFTYAPNRWRIELFYRQIKGFHEENREYYDSTYSSNTPFYQYPDMTSRSFGADIIWTYNIRKRFSIGAPYSYTTRQKKSAGSFLFYLGANHYKLNAEGTYIPQEVASNYGMFDDLKSFTGTTLSVGAGWSYTLVIAKVFFTNVTIIARYPFMFKEYVTESGEVLTERTVPEDPETFSFAIGRFGAGLNFKSFFFSAYAYTDMYDYRYYTNKQLGLGITNLNIKGAVNFGMRFNKLRKKEKRASI